MKHKITVSEDDQVLFEKKQKIDCVVVQDGDKQQENFTSLQFKNLVKEPLTQIQGLQKFWKACEHFNPEDENTVDLVKSYISSSPDCLEIFKCFRSQSSTGELAAIFKCLLCVLNRTASDLKETFGKVGFNICGSLVQSHLQKIYHTLGLRQSPRVISLTLKMLTMMVMQSKDAAREVANYIDFSLRCFKEILNKTKGKTGYEIRVAYIRFVMSFFMCDDANLSRKIMEVYGFVSAIFPGMMNDPASLIQLVLTTLRERVIINPLFPKTTKVRFFAEPKALSNVAALLEWDNVMDVTVETGEGQHFVRQMAYEFLYHVCCPFKYGINFKDKALGIGEKSKNHVLLDFVTNLLNMTSNLLVRNLIVEILRACPDLLPKLTADFRLSLDPKDAVIWLRNYEMVKCIYEAQPDITPAVTQAVILKSGGSSSGDNKKNDIDMLVKMTVPGLFPTNFTSMPVLKHCLKHKSLEIKTKALDLLLMFLNKTKSTISFVSEYENWSKSPYSVEDVDLFTDQIKDTLLTSNVSTSLLVSTWKESTETCISTKHIVLKIFGVLHELFPDAVGDAKFDFTRLLFGIDLNTVANLNKTVEKDNKSDVLILEMLAKTPQQYKWFKIVENGQSAFRRLLQVIYAVKNSDSALFIESVILLKRILVTNNVLDKNVISESDVWIQHLPTLLKSHNDVAVLNYLDEICSLVVRRPVQYNSLLTSIQQKNEDKSNAVENILPMVGKDFWDSIPDVNIEQKCINNENSNDGKLKSKLSFVKGCGKSVGLHDSPSQQMSLLTLASLDNLQNTEKLGSEEITALDNYLSSVLTHIFHLLSSAEEAKGFVQIFETIVNSVPKFNSSFAQLSNLMKFLMIWSSKSILSKDFVIAGGDVQSFTSNWFWKICTNQKASNKGVLIKRVMLYFDENDNDGKGKNTLGVLAQVLLYFDTLCQMEREGKLSANCSRRELMCVAVFLMQHEQKMTEKLKSQLEMLPDVNRETLDSNDQSVDSQDNEWCLYQLILANPSVKDLFFKTLDMPYGEQFNFMNVNVEALLEGSESFGYICTCIGIEIINKIQCWPMHGFRVSIDYYTTKVAKLSVQFLQGLSRLKSPPACTRYLLLDSFGQLCASMSVSLLQTTFVDLTNLICTVNSNMYADFLCTTLCHCSETLFSHKVSSIDFHASESIFKFLLSSFLKNKERLMKLTIHLLDLFPHIATFVSESVVDYCSANLSSLSVTLISKLSQQNPNLLLHWCSTSKFKEMDVETIIMFLPVLNQVLSLLLQNLEKKDDQTTRLVCTEVLESTKSFILVSLSDNMKYITTIVSEYKDFIDKLFTLAFKLDQDSLTHIIKSVDDVSCVDNSDDLNAIIHIIVSLQNANISNDIQIQLKSKAVHLCITYLVSLTSTENSENANSVFVQLDGSITNLKHEEFSNISDRLSGTWNKLLKQILRLHFCNTTALGCLLKLLPVIYADTEASEDLIGVATVKSMIMSHSKFLTIFLKEKLESNPGNHDNDLKATLTELLLELCIRCNAKDLSEKDFGFLLGGYGCTLSRSDQNILKIISLYEQKGIDSSTSRPFLWGENAVSSFRARKNLGDTLWKKTSSNEILSCLDSSIMSATLARFPLRRRMIELSDDIKKIKYFENDLILTISAIDNKIGDCPQSSSNVYDPSFLLPVLYDLLLPENLVDCKTLVYSGSISFLMCCFASHCSTIRSLAASCLALYYQHAQTAWFSENNLTMYLIRHVRNSMEVKTDSGTTTIPRLSSVVSNFLSNVVRLHQSPGDHMFSVLNRFLLVKPQFELKNIPEFYILFFSAEMESKLERTWILNLISDGLRDMGDYHVIKKRNVFQLLMCLHDSPVSDNYVRRQIFQIFEEACSIRSVAIDLVKNIGFVTWLTEAATKQPSSSGSSCVYRSLGDPGKRQENTMHIVRVLSTLWNSLNMSEFLAEYVTENTVADSREKDHIKEKHAALAPFRIVKQIILASTSLLENLFNIQNRESTAIVNMEMNNFFGETIQVLSSCLSNLDERRKQAINKRTDSQDSSIDDFCDLQENQIDILCDVGELLIKYDNTDHAVSLLASVFIYWTRSEREMYSSKLLSKCTNWILEHALPICVSSSEWVNKFLIRLFNWLRESYLSNSISHHATKQLVECYDVLCSKTTIKECVKVECIEILNSMLRPEISIHQKNGDGGVLQEMQEIRKSFWKKNGKCEVSQEKSISDNRPVSSNN